MRILVIFFFQAEDGIRDWSVTGVQTCALPISRMVGVKIHAEYSRTATGAPTMRRLFAEIARLGKPVKIHNAGADWMPALAALAREHPALPIVVAHGGGRGAGPFFRDHPNVHFEFCSSAP